eukprot:GFUD01015685.1.p1 GENE.GFUD01015685.1~~GFUD01015685.1.p1  ORF type:complete len:643 (+),score=175.31 GFUD01015685.1:94-2022(+)
MSAITNLEVELPTLTMDSGQLTNLSLSGIIDQFMPTPQGIQQRHQPVASIHLDPHSKDTKHQITYHINVTQPTPVICDPLDNMNNFHGPDPSMMENFTVSEKTHSSEQKPHLRIIEQPKSNALRFRYQCEGRGAGALQGQHSTPEKKTFPKIQIVGYKGPAVVVVSCVTHDTDLPRAHPHNLVSPASVGRDGCKKGVCTMNVNCEDMALEFQHLGIQCVRKKDIEESLKQRKEIRVDPYRQGFKHAENPQSIDLNAVKLCFQAFLENPSTPGKYTVILPPVVSTNIFDAKAKKELQLMDISDISSPAEGGKKIIILCEKVTREDIKVKFYDPSSSWEAWGEFNASDVHKQYAISLKTPKYGDGYIKEKIKVFVELVKPSDDSTSEPQEFFYCPAEAGKGAPASVTTVNNKNNGEAPFKNLYNGGNCVTEVKKEKLRIKQESIETGCSSAQGQSRQHQQYKSNGSGSGYSNNMNIQQQMLNNQTISCNIKNMGINQSYNIQTPNYIPNIPNNYLTQMNNPYTTSQQSPDSQGFSYEAQVTQDLICFDKDVENLSGKIEGFSLADAIEASLNMHVPVDEQRSCGKRSSKSAALESGSNIVPREMARLQVSSSIDTPNISGQLHTPCDSTNLANFLNNCTKMNDL